MMGAGGISIVLLVDSGMDMVGGDVGAEAVLNGLRVKGIECALMRKDGLLVYSTMTLDSTAPNIIASLSNISEELMREISDGQKEIEISIDGVYFVVIPFGDFLLCGVVKERDAKKDLRGAAEKLGGMP